MSKKDNKAIKFGASLTKQSFKAECDINNIVAKYAATGQVTHISAQKPRYIDCMPYVDYQYALDAVNAAAEQFAALPAKIRARFDNEPARLLEFLGDEKNALEAAKLGLLKADYKVEEKAPEEPKKAPEAKSEGATPST